MTSRPGRLRRSLPLLASLVLHAAVFAALWSTAMQPPRRLGLSGTLGWTPPTEAAALEELPPPVEVPPPTDAPPPMAEAPVSVEEPPVEDEAPDLEAAVAEPTLVDARVADPTLPERVPVGVRTSRPKPPEPQAPATPVALTAPPPSPAPMPAAPARPSSGGGIVRPSGDPSNRPPVYPPDAAARGERGSVTLRLSISARGDVTAVAIDRSSGYEALDRAAVEAASTWRFQPASRDGMAVASTIRQTVHFS